MCYNNFIKIQQREHHANWRQNTNFKKKQKYNANGVVRSTVSIFAINK